MSLRTYKLIIPAGVGASTDALNVSGPLFAVLESTEAFSVAFDGEAPVAEISRGIKILREFVSLKLVNLTANAVPVTLLIGSGDVDDYRPMVRAEVATRGALIYNEVVGNNGVIANAPLVELSDATRVEITLYSESLNAAEMFLVSAAAPNKVIARCSPGEKERLSYRGDVYISSNNATDSGFVYATYYI